MFHPFQQIGGCLEVIIWEKYAREIGVKKIEIELVIFKNI